MTAHRTKLGKLKYGHRPYEIILTLQINGTELAAKIIHEQLKAIAKAIEINSIGAAYEIHGDTQPTFIDIKEMVDYFKNKPELKTTYEEWKKQYDEQVGIGAAK